MKKKWVIAEKAPEDFLEANKDTNVSLIALQLLYSRGIKTQEDIERFLRSDYENDIHDPFLFKDMEKAVKIVVQAILDKNKIVVHGDYDADGVTSAAVIYETLKILGADVGVFLPHREEDGYGINAKTIEKFSQEKIDLIITVDCGISNVKEVALAKEKGMKVIVTDHHEIPPELPEADAILDPKLAKDTYPCKYLSGAGIAYKLSCGLMDYQEKNNVLPLDKSNLDCFGGLGGLKKWLLDLVAIGTVADIAPLIGENRALTKYGLIVLRKTRRPGLLELFKQSRIDISKIDTQTIGFIIGPRLNAAGRLSHANLSFELLTTKDHDRAAHLSGLLNSINTERQQITEQIVGEARAQIKTQKESKIFFAYGENWSAGVVGLVAGKLTDELGAPTMVMTKVKDQIVGSGRSVANFNITKALLEVTEHLSRFGGHAQACGFTIISEQHLVFFREKLSLFAGSKLEDVDTSAIINIDAQIPLEEMNESLCREIEALEPFGEGNSKPRFLVNDVELISYESVGKTGKHLKLSVRGDLPFVKKMIGFGIAPNFVGKIKPGDKLCVIVELSDSQWNGRFDLQMKIVDMKKKA
ncbi:MAG TPA: single-stranded-DNA-specific exonuclease RecJ [Candidatus Bipolaricaulota bacterium]|nr:single-stranded-DNA-specific exonuclease RecJ [Candidatus Bipolaricaulota bacterium]